MGIIAIHPARELYDREEIAVTMNSTPGEGGGVVPGGLAGYVYDGAAYCPECAEEVEVERSDGETFQLDHFPDGDHDANGSGVGIVSGTDEWDYPGASCDVCHKVLDTNVLIYDDGGAHPHPVVEVRDPDRYLDPVLAFLIDRETRDVTGEDMARVMLAESFGSHGDAGDTSWIPESDVIE